jgi:putative ABC transport system permease protein
MDTFQQDFRYAFRRLIRTPGFTTVAVLTLALGIGANSAIFSVVNGVLLKPLPYFEPDRLVGVFHVSHGRRSTLSGPNFTDMRKMSRTLAAAAAIAGDRTVLTGRGEPVRLPSAEVSASFFDVLGVPAALGRTFRPEENDPARVNVVVLSDALWRDRFGADRQIVGKSITLDGISKEVIGVMPRGFAYPADRVLWTPIRYSKGFLSDVRGAWYLEVIGRARPGVTLDQVTGEVETIGKQLAAQYPDANEGVGLTAVPLQESMVKDIRTSVLVLLGAVGFVLLIACANVANLLLARAAARGGEMAVRAALGPGRSRLLRQLLTESVILSLIGCGVGLLLAIWGVELLIDLQPQGIPRLEDVRVDRTVILFGVAVATATGLLFGILPALQSTRDGLAGSLKESGRTLLASRSSARMRGSLVLIELALAVVLLTGAGLLIRSFIKLVSVDPGFTAARALTFDLSLPDSRYEQETRQAAFFEQLMPRLHSLPGVTSAGAVMILPLTGNDFNLSFSIAGRPPVPPAQQPTMQVRVATTDYFRTIGIPLERGRLFTDLDREGTTPVVLLTASATRRFLPGEEPLGKKITLGWGHGPGTPRAGGEVVGIVGDVKDAGLNEPDPPEIYLPYRQWPVQRMSLVLRTATPPANIVSAARREVYAVDPDIPVSNVRTLEEVVARSVSQPKFYMTMLTVFASAALMLAAVGVFGVLSYAVTQRTREIGIRVALGAGEATVVGLVVREALGFALGGVGLGLVVAYFVAQTLDTLLYMTEPTDPATFSLVAGLLVVISLVASYVPSRRAAHVDPVVALRAE